MFSCNEESADQTCPKASGDAFGATLTTAQRNAGDGDAVGDSTNIVP